MTDSPSFAHFFPLQNNVRLPLRQLKHSEKAACLPLVFLPLFSAVSTEWQQTLTTSLPVIRTRVVRMEKRTGDAIDDGKLRDEPGLDLTLVSGARVLHLKRRLSSCFRSSHTLSRLNLIAEPSSKSPAVTCNRALLFTTSSRCKLSPPQTLHSICDSHQIPNPIHEIAHITSSDSFPNIDTEKNDYLPTADFEVRDRYTFNR